MYLHIISTYVPGFLEEDVLRSSNCHFVPCDHPLEAVDAVEYALHILELLAQLRHLLEEAGRGVPLLHLQEVLELLQPHLNVLDGVIEAAILKAVSRINFSDEIQLLQSC